MFDKPASFGNSTSFGNPTPLGNPPPESGNGFRIYVVVSYAAFLLAGLYLGWVFFSRWQEDRALEEKLAAKQSLQAQQAYETMGGNRFEILAFSAIPPSIQAGGRYFALL